MWVMWPLGIAAFAALNMPLSADGPWPLGATVVVTLAAGAEAMWSLRRQPRRPPTPTIDDEIEIVVESVLSHGFFRGWCRSGTLAMTSEIRRHLLDAKADGKSPEMVMGPDPNAWTDEWAAASGLKSIRFYATRLVVGLGLAAMATVTFPFFASGYAEMRIDFALFVGAAATVGGSVMATHLSHIWTTIEHRRRCRRRSLVLGVTFAGVVALASWGGVRVFGELSAPAAWAVPITLAAAILLLSITFQDPFRR
jgi:hypothetical protein